MADAILPGNTCEKCGKTIFGIKCKPCYNAAWHKANKAKVAARVKAQRSADPAKYSAMCSEWRKANPEKVIAYSAAWYANNRDKSLTATKKWQQENPEKKRAIFAEWRKANRAKRNSDHVLWTAENKDKRNAWRDAWMAANPEKKRAYHQNRRARKRASGGALSPDIVTRLMQSQCGKCPSCGVNLKHGYHLDHVMPLALGGANDDGNVQLLCPPCNMKKGAKHPMEFMQSRGFLL